MFTLYRNIGVLIIRFHNLLSLFAKADQIMASSCSRGDESNRLMETLIADQRQLADYCRQPFSLWMIALLVALLPACSSTPTSLSIKMVNPETQMTLMCSARNDLGTDRAVLATVVETCARQLEARGFVRTQ